MRYLKLILGVGCFVLAILPGGLAVSLFYHWRTLGTIALFCFASVSTLLAMSLAVAGWFLIAQRNSPISRKARILILLPFLCIAILLSGAPYFIKARSTSNANACLNNLRRIDTAVKEFELQKNAGDCIKNLRQIDAAKKMWELEHNGKAGDVVTEQDLTPYIKLNSECVVFPTCPQGGVYIIGKIGDKPTCSLGTNVNPPHVLP
jgi:hypothetical protein